MSDIEWTSKYSVHVEKMDEHHRILFEIINDVLESLQGKMGPSTLKEILERLVAFTEFHFKEEEEMMEVNQYPHLAEHRKEHRIFEKMVREINEQFEEGETDVSLQVLDLTVSWLKNHIIGVDTKYSSFMNDKGIY